MIRISGSILLNYSTWRFIRNPLCQVRRIIYGTTEKISNRYIVFDPSCHSWKLRCLRTESFSGVISCTRSTNRISMFIQYSLLWDHDSINTRVHLSMTRSRTNHDDLFHISCFSLCDVTRLKKLKIIKFYVVFFHTFYQLQITWRMRCGTLRPIIPYFTPRYWSSESDLYLTGHDDVTFDFCRIIRSFSRSK